LLRSRRPSHTPRSSAALLCWPYSCNVPARAPHVQVWDIRSWSRPTHTLCPASLRSVCCTAARGSTASNHFAGLATHSVEHSGAEVDRRSTIESPGMNEAVHSTVPSSPPTYMRVDLLHAEYRTLKFKLLHLLRWSVACPRYKQDAQLSQRDRATGCVIIFAKSRRLELGDNILRTL